MSERFGCHEGHAVDRRQFVKLGAGLGALALTALEGAEVSAQGTPATSGSVDAHAHWVPQTYADALAQLGRPTTSIHTPLELDSSLDRGAQCANDVLRENRGSCHGARKSIHVRLMAAVQETKGVPLSSARALDQLGVRRLRRVFYGHPS